MLTKNQLDKEVFDIVKIAGTEGLFTDFRIARKYLPEGVYLYELRHDDEGWGDIIEIANGIMVNYFGTFLTVTPIDLGKYGYRPVNDDKEIIWSGTYCTLEQYLEKKKKEKENRNEL